MSGKLVKSAWATGNGLLVEDSRVEPGVEVTIAITNASGHRGAQATVNRADLLTAVARKRNRPTIVETQIEHWKERAQRAEATVERVRALLPKNPKSYDHPFLEYLRSALDPEPPFELPTKTWSGIVGTHHEYGELELRLFPDGLWTHAPGERPFAPYHRWEPEDVPECFTGLRLVED